METIMLWSIASVLAHHEMKDQPLWLVLVIATLAAAGAAIAARKIR